MRKRQTRERSNAPKQFLLVVASFLCGYLVASVFDFASLTSWVNKQVQEHSGKQTPQQPVVAKKPELPKPKFEFYTLLAKDSKTPVSAYRPAPQAQHQEPAKVVPPSSAAAIARAPQSAVVTTQQPQKAAVAESKPVPVPAAKESYMVQVAAFNKRQDAEHLKASLVMQGFDVSIGQISQRNTNWFRVVIGPFHSRADAEKAQITVARSERMKGMIRKMDA
ncbi:SPOR domain-containing protein [Legionella dresdenensis]|uniref:SPOR domain-containing protein n=1 Tax=Legionella dresdenensis TaxID=450200 RepID=A0ABV8CEZ2_9GAMM